MLSKRSITTLVLFFAIAIPCFAQSNELGVTVGGYFPINSSVGAGNALAAGGSFAHRIVHLPLASVYFELPVYGSFNSITNIVSTAQGRAKYSGLFVTPGLKLKLASELPISPYFVAGAGVAHFSKTNVTTDDSTTS